MKILARAVSALAFFAAASAAHGAVYTESFDDPDFGAWKTRWFGQNSNAAYIDPLNPDYRGNNVTGLTLFDGNIDDGRQINIVFAADFGASITNFSFDMLNYASGIDQHLVVYDMAGAVLLDTVLDVVPQDPDADDGSNNGYDFADSKYTHFSIDTANGVSGFSVLPFGAEGNLSIDDIVVTTAAAAVPEPASWAMMIGGLALAGFAMRRRARVAFA